MATAYVAAAAGIQSLAQEFPYAIGVAIKFKKIIKEEERKEKTGLNQQHRIHPN